MDSQKKNDIAYKRNENNDSIESEEETIDLHIPQEQKIKKKKEKSLLRKKMYSKEKIEKKIEHIQKENLTNLKIKEII
jgi:aminopeptidase N